MIEKCKIEDFTDEHKIDDSITTCKYCYMDFDNTPAALIQSSIPEICLNIKETTVDLKKYIPNSYQLIKEAINLLLDEKSKHEINITNHKNINDILLKKIYYLDSLIHQNSLKGSSNILLIPKKYINLFYNLLNNKKTIIRNIEIKYIDSRILNNNIILLRKEKSSIDTGLKFIYNKNNMYALSLPENYENCYEILTIKDIKELRTKKLQKILNENIK